MSYYAADSNGYLGDVASLSGWASFSHAAASAGTALDELLADGWTEDIEAVAGELQSLQNLAPNDASIRDNLVELAGRAQGVLLITDGTGDADLGGATHA